MTETMTPAESIAAAIRAVRDRYTGGDELAARILAGDDDALIEGQRILADRNAVAAMLDALSFDAGDHADDLLGVRVVVDAVLVAIGEQDSDDSEVNDRFKPVRLERARATNERWLADLEARCSHRALDRAESAFRDQLVADLELIGQGIEPA